MNERDFVEAMEKIVALPKTLAAIKENEFSGEMASEIYEACRINGTCLPLLRRIAFTAGGEASIRDIDLVCREECRELGFDSVVIGENEAGEIVAFLDQPI